ncbi:MAG: TonB-dependent receptor family protein [Muribaculaceae bacterium]|nr:TonB-dependent receptor family protein [Muribaculaceae bacterium]
MRSRILVLSFITLHFWASNAKEIAGKVLDKDSIPVEFANVVGFANDSVVDASASDETGHFRLNVKDNCNRIRISCIGYADTIISKIKPDLGIIILDRNSTTLQELVVKAPLITREADRFILNVSADPLSANKDAHELLKTAPGVWVTDESLSIYGQGGTIVYLGDRKIKLGGSQLISYLKSIQSSSISTIEIIPKAGAEYSADSSGGIIKINLKRNRIDGLNGSAGINVTAGEYKQWFNPFLNLSLHSGKWTINLNGNFNGSPGDKYTSYEESQIELGNQVFNGVSHHKKKSLQGNVSLGLFYDASEKDKLGFQFDFNPDRTDNISNALTERHGDNLTGKTFGNYNIKDRFHNLNASFNWIHSMDDKGSELKLISNYNHQNSSVKENDKMSWSYIPTDSIYTTDNINLYNVFVTDLSINKVLSSNWNINTGVKYTLNYIINKSLHRFFKDDIWNVNEKFDFDSSYDENILGIYAVATGKIKRLKIKLGLRGEYTLTKGEVKSYNRFDLFPNANIVYNITDKGDYTVAIGYSRYIRRPSFQALNPVVRQISDYTYNVGNPDLIPAFTNSFSLDFFLAGKFTIAAGYSQTDNPIRQMFISFPEFPERLYLTWDNLGKDRNLFIHGDGSIKLTKWWQLYSSVTYVLTSQKIFENDPFKTYGYLQLAANAIFFLQKDFSFTINCFYNTKMRIGNITVFPILNLNPTFQKRIGRNWSLSLSFENMLQRRNRIKAESSGYSRFTFSKSYMAVKIGVIYTFNSGKRFRSLRIEKNMDNSRFNKE